MQIIDNKILLDDEDFKEIFSLFSSPTDYEVMEIYSKESNHYYKNLDLQQEYFLNQEKREFSIDAWRSIIIFLQRKGFSLLKDGENISLSFIEKNLM